MSGLRAIQGERKDRVPRLLVWVQCVNCGKTSRRMWPAPNGPSYVYGHVCGPCRGENR